MKTIIFIAIGMLTTASFADGYSCYVGSKIPVRYYEFSVMNSGGNEVFAYGTVEFPEGPSDKEAQKSLTCKKYARVGQSCEILTCFSHGDNSQCSQGRTYRCHRANNLDGEISDCH